MPAELVALAAGTPTPGIVERVLALKALPELADQQPDDLATLARATTPLRLAPGETLPADRALHFLVDGSVRELRRGDPGRRCDAPSALGLLEALAGVEPPEHVAEVESTTLEIAPSALVEVLEEQFELWRAFLRPVCHALLRGGDASWVAGAEAGSPGEALSPPIELADRVALLRASPPFERLRVYPLAQLAAEMEPVEVEAGAVVWQPQDAARHVLLIAEGVLRLKARRGSVELGAGRIVGLAEALSGRCYGLRAKALSPLRALRLDAESLIDVLEDDAGAAVQLLGEMAREALARS